MVNLSPKPKIKGNTHVSESQVVRAYQEMIKQAHEALLGLERITAENFLGFYQRYGSIASMNIPVRQESMAQNSPSTNIDKQMETARRLNKFIVKYRGKEQLITEDYCLTNQELEAALSVGVFDLVGIRSNGNGEFNFDIPNHLVQKTIAMGRYGNQAKGHKIGIDPKPAKRRKYKRVKFEYKPEIPYQNAGNGEYLEGNGEGYEEFQRSKYDRKNHPDQSIPKVEWKIVRKWRNKPKNRVRLMNGAKTTRQSESERTSLEYVRDQVESYFQRHGRIPRSTGWF